MREGDAAHLTRLAKDLGDLGQRLSLPASVCLLVFCVWLVVVSAWNFTGAWILIGLTGIAITIVTGAFFLGPQAQRLGTLAGERDPTDPGADPAHSAISRIDLVVLVLVLADMVFKPGS